MNRKISLDLSYCFHDGQSASLEVVVDWENDETHFKIVRHWKDHRTSVARLETPGEANDFYSAIVHEIEHGKLEG